MADNIIKDIALAPWGRKEIEIAETEMPGLMSLRAEFGQDQPLKGARVAGSLHMTIQTAVLIETLQALGADVRWAIVQHLSPPGPCGRRHPQPGIPVCSPSRAKHWRSTGTTPARSSSGRTSDGSLTPNMILDDGGDATLLCAAGTRRRQKLTLRSSIILPTRRRSRVYKTMKLNAILEGKAGLSSFARSVDAIKGVSEETTTGRPPRLYPDGRSAASCRSRRSTRQRFSVTKSKFDNLYGYQRAWWTPSAAAPT